MKRCPECRRDYSDDTLLYCLDDGNELLDGPATLGTDEPATAILRGGDLPSESPIKQQINTTNETATLPSGITDVPKRGFDKRLLAIPLLLAIISLGGYFGYKYLSPTKQIESIAVMPFVNASGNADVEYLSDGMTEMLISSLSSVPNLTVKPRTTVFRYKGKETDAQTIGKELNVQGILNGRVVQRGDQLTLSLELIDAEKDIVLWSQQYVRKQSDLVSLQSEIARDVSGKLKSKLSGADAAKVEKNYTANPDAYQLYLKGRFYWNKRTREAYKKAIEFFDQALEKDANYALAYAGLADCYSQGDYPLPPKEKYPLARQAALKALELDDTLAEPHTALGRIRQEYDWDREGAEKEFKRAIELNPNSSLAHMRYGGFLTFLGNHDEAIAEATQAVGIDPLSALINWSLAYDYYWARRYDEAIEQDRKTLEIDSGYVRSIYQLGLSYEKKGMYEKAFEQYLKWAALADRTAEVMAWKAAYTASDVRGYHLKQLDQAIEKVGHDPNSLYDVAVLHARLGEKEPALEWLKKAVDERANSLVYIKVETAFDNQRSDPRFVEIMKRVGLVP